MTNPNTWTSNAMEVGVASADPDVADENLEYLKYEVDNTLSNPGNPIFNLIGNQDTDGDHDINFARVNTNYNAEVLVRDSSYNVRAVTYASEMTKQIDATWAAGDDAGGLDDNDSLASGQCLYGFLLCKSSDNSIDFGFTDDVTGASMLTDAAVVAAGFDEISVVPIHYLPPLDGSNHIIDHKTTEIEGGGIKVKYSFASATKGIQEFYYQGSATVSRTHKTMTAPPNVELLLRTLSITDTAGLQAYLYDNNTEAQYGFTIATTGYYESGIECIKTDSNRQIDFSASSGHSSAYFYAYNYGYKVSRRS